MSKGTTWGGAVIRQDIEQAVSAAPDADLTSGRLDEIVLGATRCDAVAADLFDSAGRTRAEAEKGIRAQEDAAHVGCLTLLTLVVAAVAAGGIFGRFGQSPGLTWLPPVLSPVVAGLIVVPAAMSVRRPVVGSLARVSVLSLVLIGVAGVVNLSMTDTQRWERASIVASLAVATVAVAWIHIVRARKPEEARDRDLALLRARRAARASLEEECARSIRRLDERLRTAQVDLTELEGLWEHAAECAERRGVTGLERTPGPVGSSKLSSILTIPRDHREDAGERAEAAWEARRDAE